MNQFYGQRCDLLHLHLTVTPDHSLSTLLHHQQGDNCKWKSTQTRFSAARITQVDKICFSQLKVRTSYNVDLLNKIRHRDIDKNFFQTECKINIFQRDLIGNWRKINSTVNENKQTNNKESDALP